jgi:hypothetical protein
MKDLFTTSTAGYHALAVIVGVEEFPPMGLKIQSGFVDDRAALNISGLIGTGKANWWWRRRECAYAHGISFQRKKRKSLPPPPSFVKNLQPGVACGLSGYDQVFDMPTKKSAFCVSLFLGFAWLRERSTRPPPQAASGDDR